MRADEAIGYFRALPWADLRALTGDTPALILAPHADDESLGCGGFVAEACEQGRPPVLVVVTDGSGSHPNSRTHPPKNLAALRASEVLDAAGILGLPPTLVHFLGLPDTAAPHEGEMFDQAVGTIATLANAHGCATILAPWRHDPHCDHLAAHLLAKAACRRTGARLLSYPVWGWALPPETALAEETITGWRLDIAAHLPAKRRAIAAHRSQHGGLITDDPSAFRLDPAFLKTFDQPYEVFLT